MNDLNVAKQRVLEYDRKKQEDIALINALTGAVQQCENFLQELDNEEPEMASDDGNDKD
jgi:prephenate dehydratase